MWSCVMGCVTSMVVERGGGCWRQVVLGCDDVVHHHLQMTMHCCCHINGGWACSLADVALSGCSGCMACCCCGGWLVVDDDGRWWQQLVRVMMGSMGHCG